MYVRYAFARAALASGFLLLGALAKGGELPTSSPRPIPLTRPLMKQYLEDLKERKPRIPLPELTEEEKAKLGERGSGYESRIRTLYLPEGDQMAGFGFGGRPNNPPGGAGQQAGQAAGGQAGGAPRPTQNDPANTLEPRFKTELFWIVSRTNNCQYCLGHQEGGLLNRGMTEDQIAALDGDWAEFTLAEQAAFAFSRKFTLEPHLLSDADIAGLKKHYSEMQILEMILSMAGNNAINRWKEGAGVPQSRSFGSRDAQPAGQSPAPHTYVTPTSERFQTVITKVAPIAGDVAGKELSETVFQRPALESPQEVEDSLAAARAREARLPLVDHEKARETLGDAAPEGELPQWARLLANFTESGKRLAGAYKAADEKGDLSPLLKAQVSWIVARQDRAWYAVGHAKARLAALGQSDEQIYTLDGDWSSFTPAERAFFTVARKLAASPVVLTDDDVAAALKLTSPREVVQLISYTTLRASFDRITEAAGLRLED